MPCPCSLIRSSIAAAYAILRRPTSDEEVTECTQETRRVSTPGSTRAVTTRTPCCCRTRAPPPSRRTWCASSARRCASVAARGRPSCWSTALLVGLVAVGGSLVDVVSAAFGPPAGLEEAAFPLGRPAAEQPARPAASPSPPCSPTATDPSRTARAGPSTTSSGRTARPPAVAELIQAAVARVSAATGLQFVDDGATQRGARARTARPTSRTCTGRAGHPCSIAWSTAAESPELAGDVAGIAGSASVTRSGRSVYVTGSVTLDSDDIAVLAALPGHPGDRARRRHPRARPPGRPRPRRRPDAAHVPEHERDALRPRRR